MYNESDYKYDGIYLGHVVLWVDGPVDNAKKVIRGNVHRNAKFLEVLQRWHPLGVLKVRDLMLADARKR